MDRLLIATTNRGKSAELRALLEGAQCAVESLADHAPVPEVEETGLTFFDNALLKATQHARTFGRHTLADDSGLCVDALAGAPGVKSARWALLHDAGSGDADNNRLLLEQLRDVPDDRRSARFVCALVLVNPAGELLLATRASFEGVILREPLGNNGFGYDPLLFLPHLGRTSAQLEPQEKNRISHRGVALRHMLELMRSQQLIASR